MPDTLTVGDYVRVADREASAADTKSGLFYNHYSGLTGTIAKIYDDETAALAVELSSLPKDMRTRHEAGSEAQRQKWLGGLSDEARNRLSAAEKRFSLRYTVLIGIKDLAAVARASLSDIEEAEARHLQSRQRL